MCAKDPVRIRQYVSRLEVSDTLRRELMACWVAVTNTGGDAGSLLPPVTESDITPLLDSLIRRLDLEQYRLLVAFGDRGVLGWAVLRRAVDPLIAHWGSLHHVQSHPEHRRIGVGAALVRFAERTAVEELELEQLRIAVRAGAGVESFYARLGWREVGRWPSALRLAAGDDRDEVLLHRWLV